MVLAEVVVMVTAFVQVSLPVVDLHFFRVLWTVT
jgi:hypothetical protein